ncbi:hydrogenase maturation nickel metallochaperone HypA [Methylogaea oryzae]|uniref:Hydrogenase maturation factor HypA n=1 Tax=Methylogaea oryzae TaxID=1295382 RepID=A0A8D5AJL2_9GAMM|nr:hydrogenase maturation nickel metallochaperone HypA [Methylogaea oryzae]BBL70171.1 putative hydrogenase nickel incorporation protein HypA 2 [Methylogaea oryzae]
MHELSLCQGILDTLETESRKQNFHRVRSVQLEIGALSGVDEEALRFGWEAVSPATLAAGSVLDIVRIPGSAWCFDCQDTVQVEQYYDPCPRCQGHKLQVNGGEQLKIKQLEVE